MVRKKQQNPTKKATCPKPLLFVRSGYHTPAYPGKFVLVPNLERAHGKRSQNLFGGFPKQVNTKRPRSLGEDRSKRKRRFGQAFMLPQFLWLGTNLFQN
tara:strand:- start:223 stop:519 length:297 start_codon:yes stop_codon:yes gene_type:complete